MLAKYSDSDSISSVQELTYFNNQLHGNIIQEPNIVICIERQFLTSHCIFIISICLSSINHAIITGAII